MHSVKFLVSALAASAVAISPVAAKPGGGKGNSGAKGDGKPAKEKVVPANKGKAQGGSDKAKPAKSDKAKPGKPGKPDGDNGIRSAGIAPAEAKRLAKQHGFGGYKPLPPGIRKNLMRGKPLPPGLARTPIPPAFLATLPVYPGHEWRAYGSDLVLVSLASHIIADVLIDALD